MKTSLEAIEAALNEVNSTGYEVSKQTDGYVVTIYGVKEGAKAYATKSKQSHAVGKTFAVAFERAYKTFKETK